MAEATVVERVVAKEVGMAVVVKVAEDWAAA